MADYYVAQTAQGAGTGADPANALAISWANTASNWSATPGTSNKLSPGDFLHFVGNITSPVTIQGSGTSGARITLVWESGAKFSAATWNGANNNAAIYANGKSYITIDGGLSGVVEATDSGTSGTYTHQSQSIGILVDGTVSGWTVKNLTVQNMYRRTSQSDEALAGGGRSIYFSTGGSDITVEDCVSTECANHIFLNYAAGATNYTVRRNTISAYSVGVNIGNANSSGTLAGCSVYGNDIEDAATWGGVDAIHCDAIHVYSVGASSSITGLNVYGNKPHGDVGDKSTGMIYIEGVIDAPRIYNNIFDNEGPSSPAVGLLVLKGADGALVFNNTFNQRVTGTGTAIGCQGWFDTERHTIKNNMIVDCNFGIYETTAGMVDSADYNLYTSGTQFRRNGATRSFTEWQGSGFDTHGTTGNPDLDAEFAPQAGSPAIDAGTDLSAYFTTDYNGDARNDPWDIGAIRFVNSMADSLTLTQTANTDPVAEVWYEREVGSGSFTHVVRRHSGPYPSQPVNGYERPVAWGKNNAWVYVFRDEGQDDETFIADSLS